MRATESTLQAHTHVFYWHVISCLINANTEIIYVFKVVAVWMRRYRAQLTFLSERVLRHNIESKLVGMNLLPTKFTMKELQKVYESILEKPLRHTTFQRRMLSLGILSRHEKRFSGESHRAPYLYSFSDKSTTGRQDI